LAKAKGIRVSTLAKELGIPSRAILDKCAAEGLADKVPSHTTVISLGLAETVRQWFGPHGEGGLATAVEVAPPVEVAPKKKVVRRKKKTEEPAEEKQAPAEVPPVVSPAPAAGEQVGAAGVAEPVAEVAPPAAPVAQSPVVAEAPRAVEPPPPPPPPEPTPTVAPAEVKTAAPPVEAATPSVPATEAVATAPAAPPQRPTVTLESKARAEKSAVAPPRLHVPKPAIIQGPKVIRIEKPEVLPEPRSRRPAAEAAPQVPTGGPRTGRGVKISDEEAEERAKKKAKGGTLSSRRRGPDGRRGEALEKLREWTNQDLIERQERLAFAGQSRAAFEGHLRRAERSSAGRPVVQKENIAEIEEPITVKALSAAIGVRVNELIAKLMRQGVMAGINQSLDRTAAEAIALEYGIELKIKERASAEELLEQQIKERAAKPRKLVARPPVVTILGHVDHGKTSLLDRIRNANVAAGEAGGITQHIGAWQVELGKGKDAKRVTFIDTPGHQAFTAMRARGAKVTDIVVLVVSAAEGVQPQTVESINHAKAAGVPIVVALNKIDRADANPDMVLGQLAKEGVNPAEWGGDVEVVRTSATTGQGISELIELLDLQAQVLELKADPTAPAVGTVIEARRDEGLGPVATVLVQDGTLRVGDIVLAGAGQGRARSLWNDRGESVAEAGPSSAVILSGLDEVPAAGDRFYVLEDADQARAVAEERKNRQRQQALAARNRVSLDNVLETIKEQQSKEILLIIKGDVQGTVEALKATVTQANTDEVQVRVIHAAVGGISESDVELAAASKAVIVGFQVVPDEAARQMAEQRRVEIRLYRVIYELLEDLKKALSGMLEPEIREKLHGHAEIRQVFKVSRVGNIAGCMVTDGHIQRGSRIRLTRDGVVVTEDIAIESLRRGKDDVREVKAGFECGIKLAGYDDIKVGDVLEAYVREKIERTL